MHAGKITVKLLRADDHDAYGIRPVYRNIATCLIEPLPYPHHVARNDGRCIYRQQLVRKDAASS